jgi:hypothetical protein
MNQPDDVEAVVLSLLERNDNRRILELVSDLTFVSVDEERADPIPALFDKLFDCLPSEIETACRAVRHGKFTTEQIDNRVVEILESVDVGENNHLRLALARALSSARADVTPLLEQLLRSATTDDYREIRVTVHAVELTASLGLSTLLKESLTHRFAAVRERALIALAQTGEAPLAGELLALAHDKGRDVRRTLVKLLGERIHPAHVPTLLCLAADESSNIGYYYDSRAHFPIAREAAQVLLATPHLDSRAEKTIEQLVDSSNDEVLVRELLAVLVSNCEPASRKRVVELALQTGSPPLHRLAAWALWEKAEYVEPGLAESIADSQLMTRAPVIAALFALLMGARASLARVQTIAIALSLERHRRALLVPLWLGATAQETEVSNAVASLLPETVRGMLSRLADTYKLPANSLDELGEVRVVEAIRTVLPDLLEPRRSLPSRSGGAVP